MHHQRRRLRGEHQDEHRPAQRRAGTARSSAHTSTTHPSQQADVQHHHRRVVPAAVLDAAARERPRRVALRDDQLDEPLDADERRTSSEVQRVTASASPPQQHQLGAEARTHRQQQPPGSPGRAVRSAQGVARARAAPTPTTGCRPRPASARSRRGAVRSSPSASAIASSTFGPPGCATQAPMSADVRPWSARKPRTSSPRYRSHQVGDLGGQHDPEARCRRCPSP